MKKASISSCSLIALAVASAAFVPGAACAQASPSTEPEIVVTAAKREQRLIDVPQSVTVVSAESLAKLNAVQFRDYANTIPGLNFTTAGAGQSQVNIRGVTTGTNTSATVGLYVDEVPYGSSSAFAMGPQLALDVGLFDLDRIEVLRGPQGTLYGAGAMGGLIKYVTKKPQANAFLVDAQAGVSDTHYGGVSYNGNIAINAPIAADKAAVRVSGFYSHDAGYIDNLARNIKDINQSKVYGGRVDLLLTPTEKLSVRLTGYSQNIARDGTSYSDYSLRGAPIDGALDQRKLLPEPFRQSYRLASGTIGYDLGFAALTSVSSYQKVKSSYSKDGSALYVPLLGSLGIPLSAVGLALDQSTRKFVQEIRLASSGRSRFQWLLGGYYDDEKSGNFQQFFLRDLAGNPSPINLATVSLPSRYREYAAFANLTYHLTDSLEVNGGIRYAHSAQRYGQIGSGLLIGSAPTQTAGNSVVTYLANASYHFSSHASAYVRFATGYRPGGPNFAIVDPVSGASLAPPTFKPDSLKSYEGGIKAETADRRFSIDASVYYIDWSQIQLYTSVNGITVIANALNGGAHIRGAELAMTARPAAGLTFTGAFAYENAKLASDTPQLSAVKGDRLPDVPKFTATVTGDYEIVSTGLRPTIGATVRFVSDRVVSYDSSASVPQYHLPSYTAVDLRGVLHVKAITAQIFVRNVFDVRGQLSGSTAASAFGGPAQVSLMQPRTIGISLSTHF